MFFKIDEIKKKYKDLNFEGKNVKNVEQKAKSKKSIFNFIEKAKNQTNFNNFNKKLIKEEYPYSNYSTLSDENTVFYQDYY